MPWPSDLPVVAGEGHMDQLAGANGDLGDDLPGRGRNRVEEGQHVVLLRHTLQRDNDRMEPESFLKMASAVRTFLSSS